MKYNKKHFFWYLASIFMLIFSCALFIAYFLDMDNLFLFAITVTSFIATGVSYYYSNKKIACEDGYNWLQAFIFYKRCLEKNVVAFPNKIKRKDVEIMHIVANDFDFCQNFDDNKLKKVFQVGFEVSTIFKRR